MLVALHPSEKFSSMGLPRSHGPKMLIFRLHGRMSGGTRLMSSSMMTLVFHRSPLPSAGKTGAELVGDRLGDRFKDGLMGVWDAGVSLLLVRLVAYSLEVCDEVCEFSK